MKHFTVEQHEHIQVWTISNPPMNYMTAPMSQELLELVGRAENDANTRAIILTGGVDGKFITHYSVDELAAMAADPAACAQIFPAASAGFHRMLDRIMLMPKAVIAAINGDCMGGGYEFALACDFRLAADGPYQIGLPEAVLGILPGGGGTQRLPRLIGRGRALEVLLFGNVYSPREAANLGMVNRVVPGHADAVCDGMGANSCQPAAASDRSDQACGLPRIRSRARSRTLRRAHGDDGADVLGGRTHHLTAYNDAVARDPMSARSEFLKGAGVPPSKGT